MGPEFRAASEDSATSSFREAPWERDRSEGGGSIWAQGLGFKVSICLRGYQTKFYQNKRYYIFSSVCISFSIFFSM